MCPAPRGGWTPGGRRLNTTDAGGAESSPNWFPTEDDIRFYESHGWWVAARVFSDDELARATEAAFRFYERPDTALEFSIGFSNWTPDDGPDIARNNEFVSLQSVGLRSVAWSARVGAIAARLA